ncbi:MAG: flagellar filament capping protein FliD [Candidatus Lindowbacteria bacterium]|nr:flagellar filament capping protein FliD [Candidatus Lindowbacteria bacterium]
MSGISFSGLAGGIDFDALRQALIQVEQAPGLALVQKREDLEDQKDAFDDVSNRLNTLQSELKALLNNTTSDMFQGVRATSSNSGVISATADTKASPATYSISVQQLATSETLISTQSATVASFTSVIKGTDLNADIHSSTTQMGSLHRRDNSAAFVNADLGQLSINDGVTGAINVDLAAGGITSTSTVQQAMTYINEQLSGSGSGVTVGLNATSDGLLFSSSTGNVSIADGADGNQTATKLGVVTSGIVAAPVDGGDLNASLQSDTPLSVLNGGTGVTDLTSKVILRQGASKLTFDLSTATTVGDITTALTNSGMTMTGGISSDGTAIEVTSTVANRSLAVLENGGTTASDLGIFGEVNVLKIKKSSDTDYTSVYLDGGLDGSNATLSTDDIRDSINKVASEDFSASVVDNRLIIKATGVGSDSALNFKDTILNAGVLEQMGVLTTDAADDSTISSAYAGDTTKGGTLQVSKDSKFSVDGVVVTRSSNADIKDVLTGVTINLLGVSDSTGSNFPADYESSTLTVQNDDDAIANGFERIVNQYNSVVDFLNNLTKTDPDGEDGVLSNSSTARALADGLWTQFASFASGTGSKYRSLFELQDSDGNFAFVSDATSSGKFTLNKEAFKNVLKDNREDVEKLLRADSTGNGSVDAGLLFNMQEYVDGFTNFKGIIAVQLATFDVQLEESEQDIIRFEERISRRNAQLKKQFAGTESLMAGLQAESNYIASQLASLR